MDWSLHSLELSLWRDPCPIPLRIPSTSTVSGHVDKGRYITTLWNTTLSLPLKWRTMLWLACILQHHAVYHAGFGSQGHIFASLVWFYDGLFRHLAIEAPKHSAIGADWSLPAWDRFMTRIRLNIGHSPLALHTFQTQLTEAYANQPTMWYQGLRQVIENDSVGWKSCLLTVALQHFQDGLPAGTSTEQAWVDMQYRLLLDDLQPVRDSKSGQLPRDPPTQTTSTRSVVHKSVLGIPSSQGRRLDIVNNTPSSVTLAKTNKTKSEVLSDLRDAPTSNKRIRLAPAPEDQLNAALHTAVSAVTVTPQRKPILDGDGNPWVSPVLASSDDEDSDCLVDEELPTFDIIGNEEPGELNDTVQDNDDLIALETNIPIEIAHISYSDNECLPPDDSFASGQGMINPEQHAGAPRGSISMITSSHDIDMEPPEDPPEVLKLIEKRKRGRPRRVPQAAEEHEADVPEAGRKLRPRKLKGAGISDTAANFPIVATSPQKKQAPKTKPSGPPALRTRPFPKQNVVTSEMAKQPMPFKPEVILVPTQVKPTRGPESPPLPPPISGRTIPLPSAAAIKTTAVATTSTSTSETASAKQPLVRGGTSTQVAPKKRPSTAAVRASTSATGLLSTNTNKDLPHQTEASQSFSSPPAWLKIILDNAYKFHHKEKTLLPEFIEIHQSLDQALANAGAADGHITKALRTWVDIKPQKHAKKWCYDWNRWKSQLKRSGVAPSLSVMEITDFYKVLKDQQTIK